MRISKESRIVFGIEKFYSSKHIPHSFGLLTFKIYINKYYAGLQILNMWVNIRVSNKDIDDNWHNKMFELRLLELSSDRFRRLELSLFKINAKYKNSN